MLKNVLTYSLKPEHRAFGLYLEEDPDGLYLKLDGKVLKIWLPQTATIASIWFECDQLLNFPFLISK